MSERGGAGRILVAAPGFRNGSLFNETSRDNVMEPWVELRDRLAERGYAFETADDKVVRGSDRVIIWDWAGGARPASRLTRLKRRIRGATERAADELYADCRRAGLADRMVFIIGEPPTVSAASWNPRIHELFDVVLTYDDRLVDGSRYHKYFWPVAANYPKCHVPPLAQRKLLTSISANKSSDALGELYSARRSAISYFEAAIPMNFDLYGVGWERPTPEGVVYKSYRCAPANKWDVLPWYRFCLCYENTDNVPGYVTEKIFDALRCGCVPIYLGAPNVRDYVNPHAFVDRRDFASHGELLEFISSVTPEAQTAIR